MLSLIMANVVILNIPMLNVVILNIVILNVTNDAFMPNVVIYYVLPFKFLAHVSDGRLDPSDNEPDSEPVVIGSNPTTGRIRKKKDPDDSTRGQCYKTFYGRNLRIFVIS
jgi:hypothetical protein